MRVHCADCGEPHDLSELQMGYDRPDAYFAVHRDEREERWELDQDLGVLDGRLFFIRGLVEIPVRGEPRPYAWGVWARVDEEHFRRYDELWDDPGRGREPPFPGRLANQLPGYPQTLGLPVTVRLGWGNARPTFTVDDPAHPLAAEQKEGVYLERVLEMVSPALHPRVPPPLGTPRLATLAEDRWTVEDAVELYRSRSRVHWLPDEERRRALLPDQLAKLPFRIVAADEEGGPAEHTEWMWVQLDERREGEGGGVLYAGYLANQPFNPGLAYEGMRVWFTPDQVLDCIECEGAPRASESAPLHCRRHGASFPCYVCGHLVGGRALGFHQAEDPGNPRPDAWCDACEAVLEEEGEWNERCEAFAGITVVCGGCYDALEEVNRRYDAGHC
jgi:hypothetical protein